MSRAEVTDTLIHISNLLSDLGNVDCMRIIGGWGFLWEKSQFAIFINEKLYFHVDDELRKKLTHAGSEPFTFNKRGEKVLVERYHSVPEAVIADRNLFLELAQQSFESSFKSRQDCLKFCQSPSRKTDKTVLIVCTSHSWLGNTGNRTGLWFEELSSAYYVFRASGFDIQLTSPNGGEAPVDPGSFSDEYRPPCVSRYMNDDQAMYLLKNTIPLTDLKDSSSWDGVYLVGGHGTMWDFPDNNDLARLLSDFVARKKPIGAICHGAAALLNTNLNTGRPFASGKRLTAFSNHEEDLIALLDIMPFALEDQLVKAGARYVRGIGLESHHETDDLLVTGQNPMSSCSTTRTLAKMIAGNKRGNRDFSQNSGIMA